MCRNSVTTTDAPDPPQLKSPILDREAILVLGDWFVDEHWVCGVHRSSSSSRTGQEHLRALHEVKSTVQAFCGAGRSASFLQQLYRNSAGQAFRPIIGLGFWHRDDTKALRSLFDPCAEGHTLFRLTSPDLTETPGIDLLNMNDALNFRRGKRDRDAIEYTTRIIRIYRHVERGDVKYGRLDWEPHVPERIRWDSDKITALSRMVQDCLKDRKVSAVIIKDLMKGVVTSEIVEWLVSLVSQKFRDARWYVSSKRWKPDWLQHLQKIDLRLLMVPQVAAQQAVREEHLSCWITGKRHGRPSREAITLIEPLARESGAKRVLVLPAGFSALAYDVSQEATECVVQAQRTPRRITVDMGGASIVFPAIVACMEH